MSISRDSSRSPSLSSRLSLGENYNLKLKFVLLGDSGVGKTCFHSNIFGLDFNFETPTTIAVEFGCCIEKVDDIIIKCLIWDTAGQKRYGSSNGQYFRNANIFIILYDISQKLSFLNCANWLKEIRSNCTDENIKIALVGNKLDLDQVREVSHEEAEIFAYENDLKFFETTSKYDFTCGNIINSMAYESIVNTLQEHLSIRRLCYLGHHQELWKVLNSNKNNNASINDKDFYGNTAVHIASKKGQVKCLEHLINHGAKLRLKNWFLKRPLDIAANKEIKNRINFTLRLTRDLRTASADGNVDELIEILNKISIKSNLIIDDGDDKDNRTALHWAARNGHYKCVKILLDRGANTNTRTNTGKTPLHWAAKRGHEACIQLLCDANASFDFKTYWWGSKVEDLAKDKKTKDIIKYAKELRSKGQLSFKTIDNDDISTNDSDVSIENNESSIISLN